VNIKRFAVVSLLATGLGLAACGTSSEPGSATTTTPAQVSPADALTNALATLKNTGYDATLTLPTQGATSRTSVDYANKAATQTISVGIGNPSLYEAFTQIGSDLWLKADFGPSAPNLNIDKAKWYKFDASKFRQNPYDLSGGEPAAPTRPLAWPLGIAAAFANVANVTHTDATHLAGVVDLTKATGSETAGKSSKADAAVPFTASLDGQGRLTELRINGTNFNLSITFAAYGSPTPVAPPAAADVLPAPDGLYQALSGTSG
jgi:hypothetical protein